MHPEDKEIESAKKHYLLQLLKAIEEDDVDPLLVPSLRKLNDLPGVVTLYSCTGHKDHGSPMAYVYFILSKRKENFLRRHTWNFLTHAPFFLELEFEHSIDLPICPQLLTRVKITGDTENIEEACLPMFRYIRDFLAAIGSDDHWAVEYPENHLQ